MDDFQFLEKHFEPELIKEIKKCKLIEADEGMRLTNLGDDIEAIPLVLDGSLKVFRLDKHGSEIPIYDINPGQSCIISINSAFTNQKFPAIGMSKTKAKVVIIPKEKSHQWFDTYPDWRKFIVELYGKRLKELVSTLDYTAEQRDKILKQNERIKQSIEYARRIQEAVLPSQKNLTDAGLKHFIYYRPRDIVSGDFYWVYKNDKQVIIAAADATGHGVPGAFMSMLGIAFLNELKELASEKNLQPNLILEKLRNKVKSSLKQTGEENEAKDGIDIALCAYDFTTGVLQYSGAHNPLYIIHADTGNLSEIKADRQPIGIHRKEKPFTNHQIKLKKGDIFYLFSDGFVDQFGGSKGRKLKHKNFKELLLMIYDLSMEEQKEMMEMTFEQWKGSYDQVDDILVIGVKV